MSENGYATKDELREIAKRDRVKADVWIDGWGKAQVQTITAGEFCRVEAAKNRALLLASGGKPGQQAAAYRDHFLEVVKAGFSIPAFSDDDRDYLLSLDSSVAEAMKEAVLAHWAVDGGSVEDAEKNSLVTTGGSSPTASGLT